MRDRGTKKGKNAATRTFLYLQSSFALIIYIMTLNFGLVFFLEKVMVVMPNLKYSKQLAERK